MASNFFGTSSDDIIIPVSNEVDYRGLGGNDTYVLSNLIAAGAKISIVDTEGVDKIQLVDGLKIKSNVFAGDAVQLTLSNDAVITLFGGSHFTFDLGMNIVANDNVGTAAQTFDQLKTEIEGKTDYEVGIPPPPPTPTFTLSGPSGVSEGGTATYTVTLSEAQAAATTVDLAFTASGAVLGTDTGAAVASGTGITYAGTVLTFAAGSTTATIAVPVVLDSTAETGESITATISAPSAGAELGTTTAVTTALNEVPVTYTLSGSTSVFEGETATYTVTASRPVDADTTVDFKLIPGNASSSDDSGTSNTNLDDFTQGAFNTFTATIAKGATTATYTVSALSDGVTELEEKYKVEATAGGVAVGPFETTLKDGGGVNAGQTFTLTTGVDVVGGASGMKGSAGTNATNGDDSIVGVIGGTATFTSLDDVNPGDGTDTFQINALAAFDAAPGGSKVSNVEIVKIAAADGVGKGGAFNLSTLFAGATDLTVAGTGIFNFTAPSTATVDVNGSGGAITVAGGANPITITNSTLATNTITVNGGSDVTVNSTLVAGTGAGGAIAVGGTTKASGVVTVNSSHSAVAGTDVTMSAVTVTGGTTVNVTQSVDSSKAATDATGATVTEGAVTVTGGTTTTTVNVAQAKAAAEVVYVPTKAGVTESASVKFGVLKTGDTLTLDANANGAVDGTELTFTAVADMTADQVAATFAGLINGTIPTAGDTQGGGADSKGTYAGASTLWTSAAASGDTVSFTSTTASTDVTDLAFKLTNTSGNSVAPTVTTTAGSAAAGATGVLGVVPGLVTINDNGGTASITNISVDAYLTGSTIGGGAPTSALTTLSLMNAGADATMVVADTAATLALALSGMGSATDTDEAVLTFTAAPTTLNVTVTGNNYVDLTAAATTALSVGGTGVFNVADVDLAALKTLTVSGSASVTLSGGESNTLTSVDTSAGTGSVATTIDGAASTYTGGAGKDTVTLATSTALTKAINLGGGDDTLSFAALGVTGSTAALSGGDGTDTLSMSTATADALDAGAQSFYTAFERLLLNTAAGDNDDTADTVTINLKNLGFQSYVTTNGTVLDTTTASKSDTLVLDNLASGGTVGIVAAAAGANTKHTVNVENAAAGASDVVNVLISSAAALNIGTFTAANVETVNITADDTNTTPHTDTMTLTAANATGVTVAGDAGLALTMTGSTSVTSINGSTMTGPLTVTSVNVTSATTITGGSGNDVLGAATGTTPDILLGGSGDDTLTPNAGLDTLTGGSGNDVFAITVASLNVNSYATITDFTSGDLIRMATGTSFANAAVTLGGTAVFQDYANAAINALGANGVGWFQYGGNTYVVQDVGATTAFVNGTDLIVQLSGLVDLSGASFNTTYGTIGLTS